MTKGSRPNRATPSAWQRSQSASRMPNTFFSKPRSRRGALTTIIFIQHTSRKSDTDQSRQISASRPIMTQKHSQAGSSIAKIMPAMADTRQGSRPRRLRQGFISNTPIRFCLLSCLLSIYEGGGCFVPFLLLSQNLLGPCPKPRRPLKRVALNLKLCFLKDILTGRRPGMPFPGAPGSPPPLEAPRC